MVRAAAITPTHTHTHTGNHLTIKHPDSRFAASDSEYRCRSSKLKLEPINGIHNLASSIHNASLQPAALLYISSMFQNNVNTFTHTQCLQNLNPPIQTNTCTDPHSLPSSLLGLSPSSTRSAPTYISTPPCPTGGE
ncbi:uncharacterized protein STEHIDRAFT_163412 [Stereum hirsutum FP-91666 SS1]|uniref:Uncharacterized protein n=1 Tax=Stereum hirsutum (strain FP-91666) TaxID=721885 RepID=R7RY82_STEHR|nr:uncharacterized protein STEHIDRAFT_163412 [Stereum hirsutum FP-91666 SS1]EIM79855.1 hypothetical protein STEHIDRAFT_163412 [Stereum hirsutum FP-91666 SS1]